ncbi:MAG: peptidase S16 [Gemmataceae bacterium]
MDQDNAVPSSFTGVVRLFPLSDYVLLPRAVQPLHIFEPRYRQMTAHALADDHLLCLVTLRPRESFATLGYPPISRIGCLARIIVHQQIPDGRYFLVVRGLCRVRIEREITSPYLYRMAQTSVVADTTIPPPTPMHRRIERLLDERLLCNRTARRQLQQILQDDLPLGDLVDLLGFVLPLPAEKKLALLEQSDPVQRAELLVTLLEESLPAPAGPREPVLGADLLVGFSRN